MKRPTRRTYNLQVYHEASEWFVEFRTGAPDPSARSAFLAWLKESPAHMAAYLEVTASWNQSGAVDVALVPKKEALIAAARTDPEVIVAYPVARGPDEPYPAAAEPRGWRRAACAHLACAACLVLGLGIALFSWQAHGTLYWTGTGEQRSVMLPDGSRLTLNSRTRVRVRFAADERDVDLLAGEALFCVAKDPARPFVVRTDSARVRAVGTEFDVYRKPAATVVTVVEGRVTVSPGPANAWPSASAKADSLSAGEQLTVALKVVQHAPRVNVAAATSWTQHRLMFAGTPLSEVAAELNRYNERQIVIAADDLAQLEIDGVFFSTNPDTLLQFLAQRADVQVTNTGTQIIVAHRQLR